MIKSCTAIFGERLRKLRIESGLSQQALSTELEISKAALCYYENGQRAPDINILACVADYFNVSADYLLGRSDVKSVDPSQKINIACEMTGLSEKAIQALNILKSQNEPMFQNPDVSVIDFLLNTFVDNNSGSKSDLKPNLLFLVALSEYVMFEKRPKGDDKVEYFISNGNLLISSNDGFPLPENDIVSKSGRKSGKEDDYFSRVFTVRKIRQSEIIEKMLFDEACEKMKEAKAYYDNQKGASDNGSNNPKKE